MSRSFLTGLNLNKNELLNARIQNLATAPSSPVAGQIYYDTDTNQLTLWNGTGWVALAEGGDVTGLITAAIDALNTDAIEEGSTNLYFLDERAQDAIGNAIAAGTQTGITVTYSDVDNKITFSVADQWSGKDTDDLTEGATNLYFTTERAQDAVGGSVGNGVSYNDTSGAISVNLGSLGGLEFNTGAVVVDRDVTDTWYDAAGAASTVAGNLSTHESDTTTHGTTGNIVGTSDSQTLTNKTLGSGSILSANLDADSHKIVNLLAPTADTDAANKKYVDDRVSGLTWKASAHLLATSDVALTGTSASLAIDGHTALDSGDNGYRILLTNQTTDTENGIYVYSDAGSGYTLTRATDADAYAELVNATIFIAEGTLYGKTSWTQANGYITSFAGQDWVQFNGAQTYNAGAGLVLDGNTINIGGTSDRITVNSDTIDIASTYVGQTSIVTLGNVTTGTWSAETIALNKGGTGSTTAAGARSNLGATTKVTGTGTGSGTSIAVAHGLGTAVIAQLLDNSGAVVEVDIVTTSTASGTTTFSFAASQTLSNFTYVIIG